ncbi:transcriptional regulator, LysR family [Loktanella fryxellensis]|uniref:Transcriptional regulator, LysR family n=1 Tax=Loktanella fryxellensis TaxID=245187 RepID=A0A1H8CX03_9RHOB|nr:LysR family transcriptional regulator [Loktanella fryxellensis]SEM99530.1 transcriptional regulator, LysR family [Loktanella fryxellensis]
MDSWDEIRTAFQVARAGTVSGAADSLGVHHATVIRHIDALEGRLGVKLFQRHARGYTPTEAGVDLLRVAQATDEQFTQLAGRIKGLGDGVRGDLVVTSLNSLSPVLMPVLVGFQREYPEIRLQFLTGDRVFRLEYGEAHVAVRAGAQPSEPDNVVQHFIKQRIALVASDEYIALHGMPTGVDDLVNHIFVSHVEEPHRAPFWRWLHEQVGPARMVLRATDMRIMTEAILAGAGIGFMSELELRLYPNLRPVVPTLDEWSTQLWLVTHVDLHRSVKVQAFLSYLKDHAAEWTD